MVVQGGIAQYVVIEAINEYEANHRAEKIGLYFDGVKKGKDCPCCGNRWDNHPFPYTNKEALLKALDSGLLVRDNGLYFGNGLILDGEKIIFHYDNLSTETIVYENKI